MTLFCLFPVDCFAGLRSEALLLVRTSVAAAAASTASHVGLSRSPITPVTFVAFLSFLLEKGLPAQGRTPLRRQCV